jgi:hypothetical protein
MAFEGLNRKYGERKELAGYFKCLAPATREVETSKTPGLIDLHS